MSNAGLVEALAAGAADTVAALARKGLRDEAFARVAAMRDAALPPGHPDGQQFTGGMQHIFEGILDGVFRIIRDELPKTLDTLFDDLLQEFRGGGASVTPITPAPTSGPVAKPALVDANAEPVYAPTTADRSQSPVLGSVSGPHNKRASEQDEPCPAPKKRAKRTSQTTGKVSIRKPIQLWAVRDDECIFRYKDCEGFFVLRCNFRKCKKDVRIDAPIVFTSYPFADGLASEHFKWAGHKVSLEESAIFDKFAIPVEGATAEQNLSKDHRGCRAGSSSTSLFVSSPEIPQVSPNKGKAPETPVNQHRRHTTTTAKASAGPSQAPVARMHVTPLDILPFPAPARDPGDVDIDVCSDDGIENIPASSSASFGMNTTPRGLNSRGKQRPDYKEKPPGIDEIDP
ncbi:hypothetical protein GGS20DRAFT_582256 [Poronia punctata]|nr:hypothetical protein GGS20DRAFT_582256 [Poronia punctata]